MEPVPRYGKPLPTILPETAEFWKAARRHELLLQRCRRCAQVLYFPRLLCFNCLSTDLEWFASTGRGTVYSYTVIHQAAHKRFEPEVPYVYAIMDLDDGARMIANVVNVEPSRVRIGMRVKTVFQDATEEISIPRFEPA